MPLPQNFPKSPYEILDPEYRWVPDAQTLDSLGPEKLLPPLVHELRRVVKDWRDSNYAGASNTSLALLQWWFLTKHPSQTSEEQSDFKYFFAQREAVETVIYLCDVAGAKDKYDLLRFSSSEAVSIGMFSEDWLRMVIKMATGSGKTKVLSLLIAWSYFHKCYEENSILSRNFLVITPNIIVLDRLKFDFEGLKIFFEDPVLPDNGFEGQNWRDDFQLNIHMQDNVNTTQKVGNIFLTNIHRIYTQEENVPRVDDNNTTEYFLGDKPVVKITDSKINLDEIVKDLDELMILNDEAHHIHDNRLAWFKSIEDINNTMKMKGSSLSLQIDVTATPKHTNGLIFVQTISDYPLVEAIFQDVTKQPIVPDQSSRDKLQEYKSSNFVERYREYIHLGYEEWKKVYPIHEKLGKKAVLFIMTPDTIDCDDLSTYLEATFPEFKDSVLTIHTKENGDITENVTSKNEEELQKLRRASNEIDSWENDYKVIVSVLMLKEGWNVKNVTTIVGLRPYSARSNILPEQTLGRGLRRMYNDSNTEEYVSVIGTDAFMDFIDSIESEGVEFDARAMTSDSPALTPLIIEIDNSKDIDKLDIHIPVLTPRIYPDFNRLFQLDPASFTHEKLDVISFDEREIKEIHFRKMTTGEKMHITELDVNFSPTYQSLLGYYTKQIREDLKLFRDHNILFGKLKNFIKNFLFKSPVDLNDPNILRNLTEIEATRTIYDAFTKGINELVVVDRGITEIKKTIQISDTRPFSVKQQSFLVPVKSAFNKIIGDSHFELQFADFLEKCPDIISYAKNYFAVHFNIDYQNASGAISNYYPDFLAKVSEQEIYIVETKGREDLDDIEKKKRLAQWCKDVNSIQSLVTYTPLYIKQDEYERYRPSSFYQAIQSFALT